MRVAVLGAGLMGAQIGVEYALGSHEVRMLARDEARVEQRVAAALALLVEQRLSAQEDVDAARARISLATTAADTAHGAELLVESLPEDPELKVEVIRAALSAAGPGAIVATNTSSLSITALGLAIGASERTVGTHYLNPPLLMPPVEIVAGGQTAPETVTFARDTVAALGKLPVVVRRDVPGFVWNRLQFALVRECAWLVENGVTTAEDVDAVMREGLARRWRRVGPLRSIALGGIDTWNSSGRNIVPELSTTRELPDLAGVAITDGDLAADAATRDEGLARDLRRSGS